MSIEVSLLAPPGPSLAPETLSGGVMSTVRECDHICSTNAWLPTR